MNLRIPNSPSTLYLDSVADLLIQFWHCSGSESAFCVSETGWLFGPDVTLPRCRPRFRNCRKKRQPGNICQLTLTHSLTHTTPFRSLSGQAEARLSGGRGPAGAALLTSGGERRPASITTSPSTTGSPPKHNTIPTHRPAITRSIFSNFPVLAYDNVKSNFSGGNAVSDRLEVSKKCSVPSLQLSKFPFCTVPPSLSCCNLLKS